MSRPALSYVFVCAAALLLATVIPATAQTDVSATDEVVLVPHP